MKRRAILLISLGLLALAIGFAGADTGIDATTETQGFHTSTTIDAVGRFSSTTDLAWTMTTSAGGISEVPPLSNDAVLYQAVYSEDTHSNGIGQIYYDKKLTVDTGAQLTGQSNIEAVKQLSFVGVNGARVYSDENIMISGVSNPISSANSIICVFGASISDSIPAYCNYVSAGSTIDMSRVNVMTTTDGRFIVPSADTPVELSHTIRVTDLAGTPSQGKVSTFMEGILQEGRGRDIASYETIEFDERTSIDGFITLFSKDMIYGSGVKR